MKQAKDVLSDILELPTVGGRSWRRFLGEFVSGDRPMMIGLEKNSFAIISGDQKLVGLRQLEGVDEIFVEVFYHYDGHGSDTYKVLDQDRARKVFDEVVDDPLAI